MSGVWWSYLMAVGAWLQQQSQLFPVWSQSLRAAMPWAFSRSDSSMTTTWVETLQHLWSQVPHNALLPLVGVLLVFWPILLSLLLTLATAWTWIFWLLTSIVLGCLQVGYATYQFTMIAFDVFGLSLLKTYSVVRNQILYYVVDRPTSILQPSSISTAADGTRRQLSSGRRRTRRRFWQTALEEAGSYENFLKIRLEPKDETALRQQIQAKAASSSSYSRFDPAMPPLKRSRSFNSTPSSSPPLVPSSSPGLASTSAATLDKGRNRMIEGRMVHSRSFTNTDSASQEGLDVAGDPSDPASLSSAASADPVVVDELVVAELGEKVAHLLATTTARLREARLTAERNPTEEAAGTLKFLLTGVIKRNHLTLDDITAESTRSIAYSGQYSLTHQSRQLIRSYYEQVEKGLEWLAEAPEIEYTSHHHLKESHIHGVPVVMENPRPSELSDRLTLIRKMKQNLGRTALMLSGGGAQAMYHLGVLRALIEAKVYEDISVISGTSGGSLAAAMCALKTPDELYHDVCIPTVSTDYTGNGAAPGTMKKENIRWFPTMMEMASQWLKNQLLVDSAEFRRTCEFYFSDYTFEEAFERTGRHVCITVSASRASSDTAQRLLLNHISTPHVTLASAIAASCALPGVMAPAKLMAKNSSGTLEPFEVDGVEWIDGSVQADLPFQRISTLFSVTSFIVSQTNFHVLPFLLKEYHPHRKSMYWRLFQTMEWDIRNRALKLSRLGLFPRIFGQDISKVFKQKYHGNLTIVPRFTTMQTLGLKVLSNPNKQDMEAYLKYGQIATWPYLNAMRNMVRLEKALDDCLKRLEDRMRAMHPDIDWSSFDDVDSIASGMASHSTQRVRIMGRAPMSRDRESDRLRQTNKTLEQENLTLKQEVERLQKLLEQGKANGLPADSNVWSLVLGRGAKAG